MRVRNWAIGCVASLLAAQVHVPQILPVEQIRELEARVAQYPDNEAAVKLLGENYALVILGVTSLNKIGLVEALDPAIAASEFASHARQALNDSKLPVLLGNAAKALSFYRHGSARAMMPLPLREEAGEFAGELLDRAIALDPRNPDWRKQRIELTILKSNFNGMAVDDAWTVVKGDLAALSGEDRNYSLSHAAMLAERAGKLDDATALAQELLRIGDSGAAWNRSNVLHNGNLVLGKVALDKGDVAAADAYLLQAAAGIPTGSPQLNSFGPNMSLALALLQAGQDKAVLQYFDLCRVFWKSGGPRLDAWTADVRGGKTPQFGGNLVY